MKTSLGGSAASTTVLNPAVSALRNEIKIDRMRWQPALPVGSNPARFLHFGAGNRTRREISASSALFRLLFLF